MFSTAFAALCKALSEIPFDVLVWSVWGSYLGLFLFALFAAVFSVRARKADKKPFFYLTNAYCGVNLATFLLKCPLQSALVSSVLFWTAGYILYGILCLVSKINFKGGKKAKPQQENKIVLPVQAPPPAPVQPAAQVYAQQVQPEPPAGYEHGMVQKTGIRLNHAISVTEVLLTKNLSKGDRQELEKLKNILSVLQIKGTLTPMEGEILNENFNMLLKLMAKYNI